MTCHEAGKPAATYRRVDGLVTCGLTACAPGLAAGPTLGNEYEGGTMTQSGGS